MRRSLFVLLIGSWLGLSGTAFANDANAGASPEQLVALALRAEIAGNAADRGELLNRAVQVAPNYAPAQWHSGKIERNGNWISVDQASRTTASEPKRAEYQALRDQYGDTYEGQLSLARWCRKNGLDDEARFYWSSILATNPHNEEAQQALGVRPYNGRLMTPAEIVEAQDDAKAARQAAKKLAPRVAKWERMLAAGDVATRNAVLDEIRAINDPQAIPIIEERTINSPLKKNADFERCLQTSEAFVAALDAMPGQTATKSLLRHATFSPLASVRESAVAALKERSPYDYVPLLLAALQMPVESSFHVARHDDGSVHYWHSLYREGREADWSFEGRFSAMQEDLQGPTYVNLLERPRNPQELGIYRVNAKNDPRLVRLIAAVADRNERRFGASAAAAEATFKDLNDAVANWNARLIPVLEATTGKRLGDNPKDWWSWWDQANEYRSGYEHSVEQLRFADASHTYYRMPGEEVDYTRPSCFAQGTPVWTNTGKRAIESLEIGDIVLAQNPDTGELAYKPILGKTVRPPSPMVKLTVRGEQVRTTLGHPFWVAGTGWRMAKELNVGETLHGLRGPLPLERSESDGEDKAFNLIVADFNSYFVGKIGLLVHDNTPRAPTAALVPGLSSK